MGMQQASLLFGVVLLRPFLAEAYKTQKKQDRENGHAECSASSVEIGCQSKTSLLQRSLTPMRGDLQKKDKALVALFGLQNRDEGCAKESHLRIVQTLHDAGFQVETYVFEMMPADGDKVDGIPWQSGSARDISTYYESKSVASIDERILQVCGAQAKRCNYLDALGKSGDIRYRMPLKLFALRQLFSEQVVAEFIDRKLESYQVVAAVSLDTYVMKPIVTADIQKASSSNVLMVSGDGNFSGYTNGLYLGTPKAVSSAMRRFTNGFDEHHRNYEAQLKSACDTAGLNVSLLKGQHAYGASFVKIRHSGALKKRTRFSGKDLELKQRLKTCVANALEKRSPQPMFLQMVERIATLQEKEGDLHERELRQEWPKMVQVAAQGGGVLPDQLEDVNGPR